MTSGQIERSLGPFEKLFFGAALGFGSCFICCAIGVVIVSLALQMMDAIVFSLVFAVMWSILWMWLPGALYWATGRKLVALGGAIGVGILYAVGFPPYVEHVISSLG
jgi:hypothetical protein